jgi:hypothetical protein
MRALAPPCASRRSTKPSVCLLAERIAAARSLGAGPTPRIVRLGHPARLSPQASITDDSAHSNSS